MKKISNYFILFLAFFNHAFPQVSAIAIWESGDNTANQFGIYGLKGTPSATNKPGARSAAVSWTDQSDNLWLFGGVGYLDNTNAPSLNDLWKYNPSTKQWTWVKGDRINFVNGIYKNQNPDAVKPGSRYGSVSWTDNLGKFWLFGGHGFASTRPPSDAFHNRLNDLWRYDPLTNFWTWMKGDSVLNNTGIYRNTDPMKNKPGGRYMSATWTDAFGNLWLFGGEAHGFYNDLWKYDIATGNWTWVKGDSTTNAIGVYGTQGIPSASNKPGSRAGSVTWADKAGNLWLFGGQGYADNISGLLNDLWKYDPVNNQWTWVSGERTILIIDNRLISPASSEYGVKGLPAIANRPGARYLSVTWTDLVGNLWLFGGYGHAKTGGISAESLNDLWKYHPATNQWTWVSGDTAGSVAGVYGTKSVVDSANKSGGRFHSVSWRDTSGNLWMFGGGGNDIIAISGALNDLWKFAPPYVYYRDADGDGFGIIAITIKTFDSTPPTGYASNNTDCNDNHAAVHTPITYYRDADGDGFGNPLITTGICSVAAPTGYVSNKIDCDDTKKLYGDFDGDGYGGTSLVACDGVISNNDCKDDNFLINPGSAESCNGVDDDCDLRIDETCKVFCMRSIPNWVSNEDKFEISVTSAGDVNGDGYDDVIAGFSSYDNGRGKVFVYYGSPTGLNTTPNWTMQSDRGGGFGNSTSSADVNGDGYSDVIIGAFVYTNGQQGEGKVFVYHGSPAGLSNTPNWSVEGDRVEATFGKLISSAGDVNNDGYDDVIISSSSYSNGQLEEGRVWAYLGSINGLRTTASWAIESNQKGAFFGYSISSAGDVNGDGYDDVIVGAPFFDNGQAEEGRVWVYFGYAGGLRTTAGWIKEGNLQDATFGYSVSGLGDVNRDGFSDVIIGAYNYNNKGKTFAYYGSATGLPVNANWTKEGERSGYLGWSVSAGDVNGDGYSDAIIGDPHFVVSGEVFIYHGSAAGLNLDAGWYKDGGEKEALGYSVHPGGDINGDGTSEIIVQSFKADPELNPIAITRKAFVYDGRNCDGQKLLTFYKDFDGDGYGKNNEKILAISAPDGYVAIGGDCNDRSNKMHPNASEICSNGIDDNCNGQVDEVCPPIIVIDDVSVYESKGSAKLTVSLTNTSSLKITITYTTVIGTAISPNDFRAKSSTLTIPAGSKTGTINVTIMKDNVLEFPEYFDVQLSNSVNGILSDVTGRVTILDGMSPPTEISASKGISDWIDKPVKTQNDLQELSVQVAPNPSGDYFTLTLKSKSNALGMLKIVDALGRIIETRAGFIVNNKIVLGYKYRPGVYYAEVTQGGERVVVKLIKR